MVSRRLLDIVPLSTLGLMLLWAVFFSEGWQLGQSLIFLVLGLTALVSLSFALRKTLGVFIANHRKG